MRASRGRWLSLYTQLKSIRSENHRIHIIRQLSFTGIEFPMTLKDISKFERLNVVSINVYGIENKHFLGG